MAMKVRRIVTGHNAAGKAVIKTDERHLSEELFSGKSVGPVR